MSGPIVRKYGFPNFEKIFGQRDLQHGVEESEAPEQPNEKTSPAEATSPPQETAKPVPKTPGGKT